MADETRKWFVVKRISLVGGATSFVGIVGTLTDGLQKKLIITKFFPSNRFFCSIFHGLFDVFPPEI